MRDRPEDSKKNKPGPQKRKQAGPSQKKTSRTIKKKTTFSLCQSRLPSNEGNRRFRPEAEQARRGSQYINISQASAIRCQHVASIDIHRVNPRNSRPAHTARLCGPAAVASVSKNSESTGAIRGFSLPARKRHNKNA